jgi:GNAT superfamily N-acetyltransferase
VKLFAPSSPEDWRTARRLIEAYAASLGVDLCFQNFDDEIEHLSEQYGPPRGAFLLAAVDGRALGCVGLRHYDESSGEIKRLYVDPSGRGVGAGRELAKAIIARGRELGYARLVLDTLPSMTEARALYTSLGFVPITAYRHNPVEGTSFLALNL